jgi:hypothetical protein
VLHYESFSLFRASAKYSRTKILTWCMRVWGRPGEAGKKGQDSGTSPYEEFILECGGLDVLEDLQDVDNDRIYKLVMELLGGRSKP